MKKAAIGRAVREYIFAINGASCSGRVGPFAVLVGLLLGSAAAVMGLPFLLIVGGGLIGVTLLLTIIQKGYKVFWSYLIFLLLGTPCKVWKSSFNAETNIVLMMNSEQ